MPNCEHEYEFAARLQAVEDRTRGNAKRLDKLEGLTETVHELAKAMAVMAEKQMQTAEGVDTLCVKVDALERQPAKQWHSLVEKIITVAVGCIVGFIFGQIGIV